MIQRVPNLDPEGTAKLGLQVDTDHNSPSLDVPMLDYELGELIWENGQLAVHGLGQPRVVGKSMPKYVWNKPRASDTLDSVVNQATRVLCKSPYVDSDDLVPCFQNHTHAAASAGTMDAMVPCTYPTQKSANSANEHDVGKCPTVPDPSFNLEVGFSTRVDSCSGPLPGLDPSCCPLVDELAEATEKRKWAEHVLQLQPTREERVAHDISSRKQSVSVSATFGRKSKRMTLDSCERNLDVGFTSTSLCSAKPTSSFTKPTTVDDHDSVFHGKPQREASGDDERIGKAGPSSVSTQRSRAAAIHNQSERKRRDKINQRIKTLQKLVPNASKTDKASMLDEIIDYVKQLQAQVQLISRMNMAQMVIPMSMQQLQMSMMAQMGLGMGMGMMNMNSNIGRPSPTGIPPIIQPAFFPMAPTSWDASGERLPASGTVLPDPFSTFLAFQKQVPSS